MDFCAFIYFYLDIGKTIGSDLIVLKKTTSKAKNYSQWRGGSEAVGEAARLMAPPPPKSYFFCLLVWDAYHVVGTTCNDRRSLRNTFEWMRTLQAPSSSMVESWWRSRGRAPWKLQRICILRYLILDLILPNNRWMVVHCSTKSQENPKGPKFSILKFLIRKKVCMFYGSSWIIFLNLRVTDQCQDRPSTYQHLSDFSKNVLFFTIS